MLCYSQFYVIILEVLAMNFGNEHILLNRLTFNEFTRATKNGKLLKFLNIFHAM